MSRTAHAGGAALQQEAAGLLLQGRRSEWIFVASVALLFGASATATIRWCAAPATSCCGGAGCPLATMWRPQPWETWAAAAGSFLGMWVVMMAAMMLPSLTPMLCRYRRAVGAVGEPRLGALTAAVALGYVVVWTGCGLIAFALGATLSTAALAAPALTQALPLATGAVVLVAGLLQFTPWKARHLACCRPACASAAAAPPDARSAWRHGLRLGLHCGSCCAGPTAILLVVGAMDPLAMALVTAAITAERLAPAGWRVAQGIGAVASAVGVVLILRAVLGG